MLLHLYIYYKIDVMLATRTRTEVQSRLPSASCLMHDNETFLHNVVYEAKDEGR